MINVTEKAKLKLMDLRNEEGKDDSYFVRVSVKGGGCSGLQYDLNFDNEEREGDQIFDNEGLKLVVDMSSYLYLHGTSLEFSDGLNGKGFQFNNPNATRTCGCGESFAV